MRLEPAPSQGAILQAGHVIMRVNTREMRDVPEEELLDVLNGLVEDRLVISLCVGIYPTPRPSPAVSRRSNPVLSRTTSVMSIYSLPPPPLEEPPVVEPDAPVAPVVLEKPPAAEAER